VLVRYRPIVVREAVGYRGRAAHEQWLFDLEQKYAQRRRPGEVRSYFRFAPLTASRATER
jgi:hypothetical protein